MSARTRATALAAASLLLAAAHVAISDEPAADRSATAAEPARGTVVTGTAPAGAAGAPVDYAAYLPAGYDAGDDEYATLYLLHGRGDTMAAWQQVSTDLDELIADGAVPPLVVVMPDAPWSERGNWYVDSRHTGGAAVETALTQDLVAHVDATYRTVDDRDARAVGGYSMGGYGALRYALARQDLFAAGLVLSPAVYVPLPPSDSSAREFGAFGVGDALFDDAVYTSLNYPALLADADPELPTHLFVAVGDDEWANPAPEDAQHDIDFESARLYNAARRVDGVTAELRIMDGGHDWDVWRAGFREGLADLAGHLRTSDPLPLPGSVVGTAADDRAGGIAVTPDGQTVTAVNEGADAVLSSDGGWTLRLATPAADRVYGVHAAAGSGVLTAGYTRGDLDGRHPDNSRDDAFAAEVSAAGAVEWVTQFGDPAAADRAYASVPAADGGLYVAGYTSGSVGGTANAGDKDALLARFSADGALLWTRQLGGPGEDKALAVTVGADRRVYVAGVTSQAMPGATANGGLDAWVARFSADGKQDWLSQFGTTESDQFTALAPLPTQGVVAVGHTGGLLGAASAGGNDQLAVAVTSSGRARWITQDGTDGDDRAAAVHVDAAGAITVAGHTDGRVGVAAGGVDVVVSTLGSRGQVRTRAQYGTPERDGADEWDESNLYLGGDGGSGLLVTGLTFGGGRGLGDVFAGPLELPPSS
ncbi:alpha/beta hydrolase-fold protein [Jiangella mangrovi]|uniref:Enterochelin esterase-like enzyme n=1 Tax=Jiangella mangrovi TaxID=1524084 RepID=A0A7W9GVN0_9ACTN|nr:alpha/beta hydrolase-fold protein [Jiangella mangrovi]MBB5790644.1 enterochelin esterase-like enzyme [Jiangella mangrovi]